MPYVIGCDIRDGDRINTDLNSETKYAMPLVAVSGMTLSLCSISKPIWVRLKFPRSPW